MKPITIDTVVELDAPPSVVWRLLTDWERQGDWMLEASDFEVLSDHREGVGVTAAATVRIGGISTRDRIRVDVWEPERHLGIEHLGWVGGRGDLRLTFLGGGRTRVDWREELARRSASPDGLGCASSLPSWRASSSAMRECSKSSSKKR